MNENDENWFNRIESDSEENRQDNRASRQGEYGARRQRQRFSRPAQNGDGYAPRYKKVEYGGPRYNNYNRSDDQPTGNRYQRPYNADRQQRPAYDGERPQRPYNAERPRRPYDGERPQRPYNADRQQRPDYNSDRPQRPYNADRPRRPYDGERPQRPYNADRPRRPYDGERPQRPYNADRPQRPAYDGETPRRDHQPQATGGYPRPQRFGQNNGRPGTYNPANKYSKKKQIMYKEVLADPDAPIRLNKYLANAGICSRREADEFITAGVVSVNGTIVTELGTKVKRSDVVKFHEDSVVPERKVYVLLNKPKDCVTTIDDPQARKTVMDYVKDAGKERIYPVGRLDRNTTGVLLLTNDGELASKLTHPKFLKKKIYHVFCDKNVTRHDLDQLAEGIQLDDGEIHADAVSYASETDKSQVGIEIHSGRNRIVRRMFEHLGYRVVKLDRVQFAGLTKKNLRRGDWRYLTEKEVDMLRMGAFE